jgi:dienelactone hydrolase
MGLACAAYAQAQTQADTWSARFRFEEPPVNAQGIREGVIGDLPAFTVHAEAAGVQTVRLSLPFAPGALPKDLALKARANDRGFPVDLRVLTLHPGQPESVRRGMVTFPYEFAAPGDVRFSLALAEPQPASGKITADNGAVSAGLGDTRIELTADGFKLYRNDALALTGTLIFPGLTAPLSTPVPETVECGSHYAWVRLLVPAEKGARILEAKLDALGTVAVQAHVQQTDPADGTVPDFGWRVTGTTFPAQSPHYFKDGAPCVLQSSDGAWSMTFPIAPHERRGRVEVASEISFLRCASDEGVPFQPGTWRRAAVVIGKPGHTDWTPRLEPDTRASVDASEFGRVYGTSPEPAISLWPVLADLRQYTFDAINKSVLQGDDYGNVTAFNETAPPGAYGMNRLNHGRAIFEEGWRSGDRELLDTVVLWCSNMYDLSLWWGENEGVGGTRYNNAVAANDKTHEGDQNFMWRLNEASTFCTKGIDSFFLAYEETGDPRMLAALRAQVAYAKKHVHVNTGEARNIGDATDFMHLYRWTGLEEYRDEALRLFRELREKLSPGDLFSQGGQLIVPDGPFMDDDAHGTDSPYAKPYIIGYALTGLPDLLRACPDEPKLRDVVRAVADFLASTVDPAGGWRYPHPRSSRTLINQGLEHAAQLALSAMVLEERGEPIDNLLDAIETVLQARVNGFERTGTILSGLNGWESNPGALPEGKTIYDLYVKPADRDDTRDYTEGVVGIGSAPPDGLVYFGEVLSFYLAHRPAERLFNKNEKLRLVLDRAPDRRPKPEQTPAEIQRYGMRAKLPVFSEARVRRMDFPLGQAASGLPFDEWRVKARQVHLETLQTPPPRAPIDALVLAVEDRGDYEARKLAFNLSADSRVEAYLLVPKAPGPHPAILALHDHGAHFTIGKEKVVKPFGVTPEKLQDAQDWVNQCYGGTWIGDELARRGYVVFATDALFWGDRGRFEGPDHAEQQALAANMLQLGMSWAGNIVYDDIRSAEFVQSLPEVDPGRIGCVGLSMGAHRTWSLCAATDIVKCGAAICWMGDTPTLMAEGNNQTTGQSAFSMLLPGIRNLLDYPDVASIACPKPMLFFNGTEDPLFPVPGVEASYTKMQGVWARRGVPEKLITKLWPVPHVFNTEMQAEAFAFLDKSLKDF